MITLLAHCYVYSTYTWRYYRSTTALPSTEAPTELQPRGKEKTTTLHFPLPSAFSRPSSLLSLLERKLRTYYTTTTHSLAHRLHGNILVCYPNPIMHSQQTHYIKVIYHTPFIIDNNSSIRGLIAATKRKHHQKMT